MNPYFVVVIENIAGITFSLIAIVLAGALLGISTAQYNKSERSIGKHELPGDPYATLKNEMASSDDDASFF